MTTRPPQCSEREPDGIWEDCTWCAGVDLGNAAHGRQVYPVSQTEYEALRAASGDTMTGGSNIGDLARGMKARWGWSGRVVAERPFAALWAALRPGVGAVVQGSMGAFSRGHHFRRWDVNYGAAHAGYAQREDASNRVWWMNPQAPRSFPGEWMNVADLRAFVEALPGGVAMLATIGSRIPLPDTATEEDMVEVTIDPFPKPIGVTGTNVPAFLTDGTMKVIGKLRSLAMGTAIIDQATDRAPKGSGWIRLAARPWSGWYVPAASVKLESTPGDPLQDAYARGRESFRRDHDAAVASIP